MAVKDWLPIRALRGLFEGMEDGFRGRMDTNTKFSDGVWGDDPEQMSAAGRFLSEYAGVRGGYNSGKTIGKIGGAVGGGVLMYGVVLPLATAIGGIFPIIAGALAVGAAAWLGANVGAVVGRVAGSIIGGIVGAIGGAVVGAFNATFKRGHFRDTSPDTSPEVTPEAALAVDQAIGVEGEPAQSAAVEESLSAQSGNQAIEAPLGLTSHQAHNVAAVPKSGIGKWLGIGAAALGGSALLSKLGQHYATRNAEPFIPPPVLVDVDLSLREGQPALSEQVDPAQDKALDDAMAAVKQAHAEGGLPQERFEHGEGVAERPDVAKDEARTPSSPSL